MCIYPEVTTAVDIPTLDNFIPRFAYVIQFGLKLFLTICALHYFYVYKSFPLLNGLVFNFSYNIYQK